MIKYLRKQKTIKDVVGCSGVGLHSGQKVNLTLKPSPENTGVLFYRKDMGNKYPLTKALIKNLTDTRLSTTIGYNGNSVHTIEHLMASFAELGIDNVIVEIDAPEVPIMDGSAAPFVTLIKKAGTTEQDAIQPYIKITNPIELSVNGKEIVIEPAERLCVTFYINYDHPVVGEQIFSYVSSEEGFESEIANARTYGFLKEVKQLMTLGLAKGGSLDNAIVIGDNAILNEGGLKFKDEFVRHKILDLLGDIALLGMPVIGHIHAKRSGHALNTLFVNEILKRKDSWLLMGKKGSFSPQIAAPATAI
jgi:UDP-3-O-[3-hydroxymyristoyl] N-acetylglucosamine deacetylase